MWNNQILFGAQMLDMFAVLCLVALWPCCQHLFKIFTSLGPESLGLAACAPAVGALCVGLYLARHPINKHAGRVLLWAVAGFGVHALYVLA